MMGTSISLSSSILVLFVAKMLMVFSSEISSMLGSWVILVLPQSSILTITTCFSLVNTLTVDTANSNKPNFLSFLMGTIHLIQYWWRERKLFKSSLL